MLKLCARLFFQFISLLLATTAIGQSYIYSDRELLFDASRDNMQVVLSPDGSTHVWRWGRWNPGRVTMDIYDKQLHLVQSKIVSRRGERLSFATFKGLYYVILMEPKTTRLLCVKNNEWVDRTAEFNKIPLEEVPVSQIRQGDNQWFFIQYSMGDDDEHSRMHITAVDSNLQYINLLHLTLRYPPTHLRNLRIHTLGNDLLLLNIATDDTLTKLTVHKINVAQSKVRSKSFLFYDEMFVPQDVFPYKTGFILEGQAHKPLVPPRRQTAYTSLLQLDSNLNQVNRFYTALADSSLATNATYIYLPVSTTMLPNDQLLVADYVRTMNFKTKVFETQLRFNRLDSTFTSLGAVAQTTAGYTNYPSFMFNNGRSTTVYYEEEIRTNIVAIHSYRLGEAAETDRLLQLNPKQQYFLRQAIPINATSFVMPYLRNYRLGLVKINVPEE